MSEAKVYTNVKNVRNVTAIQSKKTVFKHVLASPFILKWPTVHTELGQTILAQLLKTLTPLGNYKKQCKLVKKSSKKSDKQPETIPKPDVYPRVHVGINQVTRFMEAYIENKQTTTQKTPVIYICKREIKPLQLCQHLLYMAALAQIKLVPMPADAESNISLALGIKRACVVLVEIMENKEESLRLSAKEIPFIDAPWLVNALQQPIVTYRSDTIKTLQTTAPVVKKKGQQQQQQQQQQQLKRKNQDDREPSAKKIKIL